MPGLGWAAAFALGAIVAPTDALAATSVFRRLGVPAHRPDADRGRGAVQRRDRARSRTGPPRSRRSSSARSCSADAVGDFVVAAIGGVADRLRRRPGRGGDRPLARRSAGRGPGLAADPVPRLPAGGAARASRACSPSSRPGSSSGAGWGRSSRPTAAILWLTTLEDGRVRPQRPRVRAPRPRAAGHPSRAELDLHRSRSWASRSVVCAVVDRHAVRCGCSLSSLLPNSPRRRIARRDPALAVAARRSWSAGRGSGARCRWPRPSRCRWTSRRAT